MGPATLTASVTGGNYGEHDEKLYSRHRSSTTMCTSGSLSRDLEHDGYGEVVPQAGEPPSPYNRYGEPVSNKDVFAGRANLTVTWGESSKLKLIAGT